ASRPTKISTPRRAITPTNHAARVSGWKVRRRRTGPSRWSRNSRIRALRCSFWFQRGSGCRVIGSPAVEPFLQDEAGRRRVLLARSPVRPPPRRCQLLPGLPAGQPLVDEDDLEADGSELLPERARLGRLPSLAAIHVAWQAEDYHGRSLFAGQGRDLLDVG